MCRESRVQHFLPASQPAGRTASSQGRHRYVKNGLSPADREKVRIHTLVAVRVAQVLDLFTIRGLPWIFEAPEASENQVSALNLDEYVALLVQPGVRRVMGVQCPPVWCCIFQANGLGTLRGRPLGYAHEATTP